MSDDILKGIYEKRIIRSDFEAINKVFSCINEDLEKSVIDELMIEIDRFRNMLFFEGILQNNQCFITIAYDLDMFITERNFNALEEVKGRFEEILVSENLRCHAFHADPDYGIFEKLKWFNHFKKATKNFKDLNGWNSLKIKEFLS